MAQRRPGRLDLQRLNQNQAESHPAAHSSPASVEAEATSRAGYGRKKTWSGNAWNWVWPWTLRETESYFPYLKAWVDNITSLARLRMEEDDGSQQAWSTTDQWWWLESEGKPCSCWKGPPTTTASMGTFTSQDPTHKAGVSPRVTRLWGKQFREKNQQSRDQNLTFDT